MIDCVYLIACDTSVGKLHKIGISIDPALRLEQIKKESITDPDVAQTAVLAMWFEHPNAREIERQLHTRYREFNFRFPQIVRGREWFLLDEIHIHTLIEDFLSCMQQPDAQQLTVPGSRISKTSPTFIPLPPNGTLTNDQLDRIFSPERQREFVEKIAKLMSEKS